ncbi:MAG: hypothetical protein A2161_22065 [Candidatus Schekmanbacteria bacterium RBG_13_48_7]|uniref:Ribbon-helix-helix protein CopG domain-containing protein n=1 Tax=Candidatus Schekmanbacteria bacterium RBG_13_48_7 TaxID=1817878 RepID=A0A1F7RZP6_9BACT|nr:MAG: hypothetical protein A2161_22065 [Candidatus Schekmanbacteria bacterium RBG_13_48_7]
MKTFTLKLPELLEIKLKSYARKKGESQSEITRRALIKYLSSDDKEHLGSFYDLSSDLAGCFKGSSDLSKNKSYLEGYGR